MLKRQMYGRATFACSVPAASLTPNVTTGFAAEPGWVSSSFTIHAGDDAELPRHGRFRGGCQACLSSRPGGADRKSTRLNSSHVRTSYAVFCLKKKKKNTTPIHLQNKKKKKTNK